MSENTQGPPSALTNRVEYQVNEHTRVVIGMIEERGDQPALVAIQIDTQVRPKGPIDPKPPLPPLTGTEVNLSAGSVLLHVENHARPKGPIDPRPPLPPPTGMDVFVQLNVFPANAD